MAEVSKPGPSPTSSGGLRTDTYGKSADSTGGTGVEPMSAADRKKLDPADPRAHELEIGESKLVASGGTEQEAPGLPTIKDDEAIEERRLAGIPEPPKPALYTDLHLTSGGYQVTPAGVSPEELHDYVKDHTRQ